MSFRPRPMLAVCVAALLPAAQGCQAFATGADTGTGPTASLLIDPEGMLAHDFALATCGSNSAPACGSSVNNQCTTTSSTFNETSYPACLAAAIDLGGSEWVAPLLATGTGDIVLSVSGASTYPFIAVLKDTGSGPSGANCVKVNYYSVTLTHGVDFQTGDRLYIVVDHGTTGTDMAFNLTVDCNAGSAESNCTDGFDNDGDFAQDCYDADCVGTAACPACVAATSLAFGVTHLQGDTAAFGSTDQIDRYACLPSLASTSREYVYRFDAASTQDVLFTASNANRYPLLVVMKDSGNGCTAGDSFAANYYSVIFHAEAGTTYYLAVDGDDNQSFNYDVSLLTPQASETICNDNIDNDGDALIDCDDTDCALDAACSSAPCLPAATLTCNSIVTGDTSSGAARASIANYSCMDAVNLGFPEVAYAFSYTGGPAERDVLLTLSNESSYAVVTAMNDLHSLETDITVKNGSSSAWSAGLLSLKPLLATGLAPQPGTQQYYTYAFAHQTCDVKDTNCGTGCDDDGNAEVLAKRWGLTLGTDAWLVPALAAGQSTVVHIKAKAPASLSYVARVQGSADDLMMMNVVGSQTTLAVPLFDSKGDVVDPLKFEISGYDVNSSSATNGNGGSCSQQCPPNKSKCYVAYNNGSTGGTQPGGQSPATKVQCNPNECVSGNFYATRFHAKQGKTYSITVEGAYQPNVTYQLAVVCDPAATESNCTDGIDNDGDYLIDCDDADCDAACAHANACTPLASVDCSTRLLPGSLATAGVTNGIDHYDLVPGLPDAGPEYTYTFTATQSGWVNFTTANLTDYVVVAVLEDNGTCDPHNAIAAQYYGVLAQVEAGKSHFVVVDGVSAGSVASYALSVVCNPPIHEAECADGIDNDGDWLTDCYDPDCGC